MFVCFGGRRNIGSCQIYRTLKKDVMKSKENNNNNSFKCVVLFIKKIYRINLASFACKYKRIIIFTNS